MLEIALSHKLILLRIRNEIMRFAQLKWKIKFLFFLRFFFLFPHEKSNPSWLFAEQCSSSSEDSFSFSFYIVFYCENGVHAVFSFFIIFSTFNQIYVFTNVLKLDICRWKSDRLPITVDLWSTIYILHLAWFVVHGMLFTAINHNSSIIFEQRLT